MSDNIGTNGHQTVEDAMKKLDFDVMWAMKKIACMDHASPNVRVRAASVYMRVSGRYEERTRR